MLLTIDVGNTNITYGVYDGNDKVTCYARGSFTVKDKNLQNVTLSLSDVPLE